MEPKVDYFNPHQTNEYLENKANKLFFELKDYLEEVGGVKDNSAGYELMELAYKIRSVIIENDNVGTFVERHGDFRYNELVDLERDILLHNIECGLYSMALKRFRQGLPLVLECDRGHGPNKDFIQVMQMGLDRYPGNYQYPMGTTNHYGVKESDIKLSSMLSFEINPRAKQYTHQRLYYTPQAQLLTERQYQEQTGTIHNYRGHIADMQDAQEQSSNIEPVSQGVQKPPVG